MQSTALCFFCAKAGAERTLRAISTPFSARTNSGYQYARNQTLLMHDIIDSRNNQMYVRINLSMHNVQNYTVNFVNVMEFRSD